MRSYVGYLRKIGWRLGLWQDNFRKIYCSFIQEPISADDLTSEEFYY